MKNIKIFHIGTLASILILILLVLLATRNNEDQGAQSNADSPLAFKELLPSNTESILPNQKLESSALLSYQLNEKGLPASIDCLMLHVDQGVPAKNPLFRLHSDLSATSGLLACKQEVKVPEQGKLILIASLRYAKELESAATVNVEYLIGPKQVAQIK